MAGESRVRTFIAVEASAAVRAAAVELTSRLRSRGDVKWVAADTLHFTLVFLGDVPTQQVPDICRAVERAAGRQPAFDIEVRGAGAFPNPLRPRTVWLGVAQGAGAGALQQLQAAIEDELKPLGFQPEDRPFTPHLTVGRVRALARGDDLPAKLQQQQDFTAGSMAVDSVVVLASQLRRGGPPYTPLGRAQLSPRT